MERSLNFWGCSLALEMKPRWPWSLSLGAILCVGCLDKLTPLEVEFETGLEDPQDTARPDTGPVEDTSPPDPDADGDGFPASQDCDDDNAEVFPGAVEMCDGSTFQRMTRIVHS